MGRVESNDNGGESKAGPWGFTKYNENTSHNAATYDPCLPCNELKTCVVDTIDE